MGRLDRLHRFSKGKLNDLGLIFLMYIFFDVHSILLSVLSILKTYHKEKNMTYSLGNLIKKSATGGRRLSD